VRLIHDSHFAPAEDGGLRVTVSVGGALVEADDTDDRAALQRADDAMYEAKKSGRDGFAVVADGERR
jgi:GGDEF domain-containing protein